MGSELGDSVASGEGDRVSVLTLVADFPLVTVAFSVRDSVKPIVSVGEEDFS